MKMKSFGPNGPCSPFEEIRHEGENPDGTTFEWWSAREAMGLLGYTKWQNMRNVISRAKATCKNTGDSVSLNFIDVSKPTLQGGPPFEDTQLSRYAMYLVAMNGEPSKRQIAAAQRYFAIQTRRAEQQLPSIAPQTAPVLPAAKLLHDPRPWYVRIRTTFMPHNRWMNANRPQDFTIVSELALYIIQLEDELLHHEMMTDSADRPDISIGGRWSRYRRDELGFPEVQSIAPLYLPEQDIEVELKVYPESERNYFRKWFLKVYIPEKYFEYVDKKPRWKSVPALTRASVADRTSQEIAGVPATLPVPRRTALNQVGGFFPAIARPKRKMLPPGNG